MKNILRFPNLMPSPDDYQVCNAMMFQLDDLAPYDSTTHAAITMLSDGSYQTVIAINALCGRFQARGENPSMLSSIKQAYKNMLDALANWKKERFAYDN